MVGDVLGYIFIDADCKWSWGESKAPDYTSVGWKTWDGRFGGLREDGGSRVESNLLGGTRDKGEAKCCDWARGREDVGSESVWWFRLQYGYAPVAGSKMDYWQRGNLLSFVTVALFPERIHTLNMYINASPLVHDSMSSWFVPVSLVSLWLESALRTRWFLASDLWDGGSAVWKDLSWCWPPVGVWNFCCCQSGCWRASAGSPEPFCFSFKFENGILLEPQAVKIKCPSHPL